MRRRDFIQLLGSAAALPLAVQAEMAKIHWLAFIHSGLAAHELTEVAGPFWVQHFFATLRRLGYAEGTNLSVKRYSAEGQSD